VLKAVEIIMREVGNLKRIGEEFSKQDAGRLSIATTHTQARYVLPEPVALLRKRFPKVSVSLHQGTPEQVAQMLLEETADIGLATESLSDFEELVTLPCYEWQHMIVVPAAHPLAAVERPTLEQLAAEPLVSYHPSFTGRTRIDQAFAQRRLKPNIVLEAIDSDVIKTYVRLGLGVGLLAEMAVKDDGLNNDLVAKPAGHLFGQNVSRVAFKRGAYLRNYVYTFAELLSDRLNKALIMRAMSGEAAAPDYQL
jgi:LysR family cys regulon transcriptional activator